MGDQEESFSLGQLRERIAGELGHSLSDQVLDGLVSGFTDPDQRTYPVERGIGESGVIYAWRPEDADILKEATRVLERARGIFGQDLAACGLAIKDLLSFWVRLRRNRVRISDPVQVAVLLQLKMREDGLTASALWKLLDQKAGEGPVSLAQVETALAALEKGESAAGSKRLVLSNGELWQCLV